METLFVVLSVFSQSGTVAVLVWTLKEVWSYKRQQLEERVRFEQELKKIDHSVQLDLNKLEHEVRFRKIYDHVSSNIISLFSKLATLKRELRKLTPDPTLSRLSDPDKEALFPPVAESYNEAFNTLHEQRLLIPVPIFREVAAYLKGVRAIIGRITSGMAAEKHGVRDRGEAKTFWEKATDEFEEMEPQYEKIHEAMRAFLGLPAYRG